SATVPASHMGGAFNLDGIAGATAGSPLIVAQRGVAAIYTVDPTTGASGAISGADLPSIDGILFNGSRLWAVQNFSNQITELRLSGDLSSATVVRVITDSAFEIPTTVARWGNRLAAVNAKFDTGFPPTAATYEVVEVDAR